MVYALKEIARLDIPATPLVEQGSYGSRNLGSFASTMTLYEDRDTAWGTPCFFIEWDIHALDTTESIGLELEGDKHIVGYDGVMSFPRPAKPWLESLGYTFAEDAI